MPKCPNCGSTAQVRKVSSTENMAYTEIYDQWKCGCGAIFQVTFKRAEIKTVMIEKAGK